MGLEFGDFVQNVYSKEVGIFISDSCDGQGYMVKLKNLDDLIVFDPEATIVLKSNMFQFTVDCI